MHPSAMMIRCFCVALIALGTATVPARVAAQQSMAPGREAAMPANVVLIGVGPMDHGSSLVELAASLNVRRSIFEPRSETMNIGPLTAFLGPLPSVHVDLEGMAQLADGGSVLAPCTDGASTGCTQGAGPYWFAGAGLVSRIHLTRPSRPVVLYALPLTTMLYARGADDHAAPDAQSDVRFGAGLGTGLGLRVRAGTVAVLLEARAISTYDFAGGHGGSIPVSIGLAF